MSQGHRFVSFAEAGTAAQAKLYVEQESGGALYAGQVEKVNGGCKITVVSSDGHNQMPISALIPVQNFADPPKDLCERKEFSSVGPDQARGWTPVNNPAKQAGKQ
jgi:hypothetical protein